MKAMVRIALWLCLGVSCYAAGGSYTLIGWNDLGMHCMDGDYSVFAILPPYNTIHAQLIDPSGKLVNAPAGITVTYEPVADANGSINSSSSGKSNFWQFVQSLFGASVAVDTGLTGNAMPGRQAQPLAFEPARKWFTADGIPLTPFDDARNKNYYPMMKLVARDAGGTVLASTNIVLPISDEMDCSACHASGLRSAARPRDGWVNDPLFERDYKLNILRRHDDLQSGTPLFQSALAATGYSADGLYASVVTDGKPVLCAACHASNALAAAGQPGIPSLTASLHSWHADQVDPVTQLTLGSSDNRGACYRCHPGAVTRCLRGVMGNAAAADGTLAIQCQSCHGDMAAVGNAARQGWLDEPNCQSCHTGTAARNAGALRYTSALEASGQPRAAVDSTYATNPDTPAQGLSLYRFSTGHGGLACEACHGSTHAEYPSSHDNDNAQSLALQGHVGMLAECGACHPAGDTNISRANLNGPHGMHPVGAGWVSQHSDFAERNRAQCTACHGTDYRGTELSRVFGTRSVVAFNNNTLNFWRGFQTGCYTCHQGPASESRNPNGPPSVANGSLSTAVATAASVDISASDPNNNAVSVWVVSQPANGTVGLSGNHATFVPRADFEGNDSFTVAAWDGQTSSNLGTVQVSVKAASRPVFAAGDVANAASFQPGPVAPGEILMFKGTGLGPDPPANLRINSAGLVSRALGGTRVLFDGAPAAVLYASAGQVNAVAPWGLAGKTTTAVQVEYGGIRSEPVNLAVGAVSPAIFPGAVVNQGGSLNSPASPVAKGSYITLYATGGGPNDTVPYDGEVSAVPLAVPAAGAAIQIGGVAAHILYIGAAPGLVSGALQINVEIPDTAPSGATVPLQLTIGGVAAPAVNIAVQ